jgi:hypothetical protein
MKINQEASSFTDIRPYRSSSENESNERLLSDSSDQVEIFPSLDLYWFNTEKTLNDDVVNYRRGRRIANSTSWEPISKVSPQISTKLTTEKPERSHPKKPYRRIKLEGDDNINLRDASLVTKRCALMRKYTNFERLRRDIVGSLNDQDMSCSDRQSLPLKVGTLAKKIESFMPWLKESDIANLIGIDFHQYKSLLQESNSEIDIDLDDPTLAI